MLKSPRERLIDRLPKFLSMASGKFVAVLGHLLKVRWTDPEITALCVTSDGWVMATHAGDVGFNDMIGPEDDLLQNVRGVCEAAECSATETLWLVNRVKNVRRA